MAIINCPECNNSVSDKATVCPRCGYPIFTSRIKKDLSKFLRLYLYVGLISTIKVAGRVIIKTIKPLILLISLLILSIASKNYYFISKAENFALQSCVNATGKSVPLYVFGAQTKEMVAVPSDLTWLSIDSGLRGILHERYFNFNLPSVLGSIDVIGRDGSNNSWVCVPIIDSRSIFSGEPYFVTEYLKLSPTGD